MSHYDVACLWHLIEKRLDIESIVQESLGQVFLLRHEGTLDDRLDGQWWSTIILLKTVFDLQRVYLQAKKPNPSLSTVLQPKTIVTIIECLINFSVEQYGAKLAEGLRYDKVFVCYLRQTIVSGLRAYQLITEKLRRSFVVDRALLRERLKACSEKWPKSEEIDQHLTRYLFRTDADVTNGDKPALSALCPSHPTLDLPDFSEGTFISNSYSPGTVKNALTCISEECSHWVRSFWILADLKLAIIAAAVQYSSTHEPGINKAKSIYDTMKATLDERSHSSSRTEAFVEYLSWIEPIIVCKDHYACITSPFANTETIEFMKDIQKGLTQHLQNRKKLVFDSNDALRSVRTRMQTAIQEWASVANIDRLSSTSSPTLQHTGMMAYVLACGKMHAVSYSALERYILDTPEERGLKELRNGSEHFNVFFRCDLCGGKGDFEVEQVRRVRPFQDIDEELVRLRDMNKVMEEAIVDAAYDSTTSENNFDTNTVSTPQTEAQSPDRSSFAQSLAHGALGINHSDKASLTSSKKRIFSQIRSVKAMNRPVKDLRLVLSIDARSVIAWTSHLASCYNIRVNKWSDASVQAPDIVLAAGGVTNFAVVSYSQDSAKYMLSIYRCHDGAKLQESVPLKERIYSMTFSRDGSQLAVGCSKHIHNFSFKDDTWSSNHYVQKLREPKEQESRHVDSQRISYSSDSLHLVIVTRYKPSGELSIGIYNDLPDRLNMTSFAGKLALSSNRDWGLTGILSLSSSRLSSTRHLIWTASCDKAKLRVLGLDLASHTLLPEKEIVDQKEARIGDRIQCATILPGTELQFVICNDSNKVFLVKSSKVWQAKLVASLDRSPISSRQDMMSAASSHDGGVRLLWLQDNYGRLVSFKPGLESMEKFDPIEMKPFMIQDR